MDDFRDKESEHDPAGDFLTAHENYLSPWQDKIQASIATKGCP